MDYFDIEKLNNEYSIIESVDANGNGKLMLDAEQIIINLEEQKKHIQHQEDIMKKALLEAMETKGISKLVTDRLIINYYPEQKNLEKFNKNMLREINPDLYDECVTMDGVKKAYTTIKIK